VNQAAKRFISETSNVSFPILNMLESMINKNSANNDESRESQKEEEH
jgi:hypothetical protein